MIITSKDNGQCIEVYNFEGRNWETVSENFYKLVMKAINQVINPKKIIEKGLGNNKSLLSIFEKVSTDNYIITDDNYKKMVLFISLKQMSLIL